MTTRRGSPTAAALLAAGRAAETKRAIRLFQTAVPRLAAITLVHTLVLALLLSPHGCGYSLVVAVERQWAPAVERKAAPVVERGNASAAVTAVAGSSGGRRIGRSEERQLETENSEGEGAGQGDSRRCWVSRDGRRRCQANVFFFGVSKCGTTSLAQWMAQHPSLRWVYNFGHPGEGGYEAHVLDKPNPIVKAHLLPTSNSRFAALAPEAVEEDRVIDYTPHYAIVPQVPHIIRELYGNSSFDGSTKYFVSLREPVARAISQWEYKFNFGRGQVTGERRPLQEAFREGVEGVNGLLGCLERQPRPSQPWDPDYIRYLDYRKCRPQDFLGDTIRMLRHHVGKSMYAIQLERWIALFGRENVKVLFLEEIDDDPVGTLEGIFDFIGLDLVDREGKNGLASREEWERIVETDSNATDDKRKQKLGSQVTPELVQEMRDFFAPHNARLEELLRRPLPAGWSTPASS
eukprot:g13099.t1